MEITPLHTHIEKRIELRKGIVILESPDGFPIQESNLYLLATNGDILWKAEKPDARALFTKVKLNEDSTLSTFTNDGRFCELNIETGKITGTSSFR